MRFSYLRAAYRWTVSQRMFGGTYGIAGVEIAMFRGYASGVKFFYTMGAHATSNIVRTEIGNLDPWHVAELAGMRDALIGKV